jgi:hypothetical protein
LGQEVLLTRGPARINLVLLRWDFGQIGRSEKLFLFDVDRRILILFKKLGSWRRILLVQSIN